MTRRMWRFWIVGLGAIAAGMALGQMPVRVAQSSQFNNDQIDDLARIQDYLNNIKTFCARFEQLSPGGDVGYGYLYISRPGRIRIEYDQPIPILIISDGSTMMYYDSQLEQTSYLPISSTPLSVLISDNIHLWGGDIVITGFERYEYTLNLTLVLRTDPNAGSLTLVFDRNPLHLNKWSIIDSVGKRIDVLLTQTQVNMQLQQNLFYFQER